MSRQEMSQEYVAQIFEVRIGTVKMWEDIFNEFLSTPYNLSSNDKRIFQQSDIQVFALISNMRNWEDLEIDQDFSDIFYALNSNEHHNERYLQVVYFNTPVFQEVPADIDETHRYGVLFGGMIPRDWASFARTYKLAGDILIQHALESKEPYELTYPILYNYRHVIEIYLKIIVQPDKLNHDLARLVDQLKQKYSTRLSYWAQNLLDQFDQLDKRSTAFRYGEKLPSEELWIDLYQLRTVVDVLCKEFEKLIRG